MVAGGRVYGSGMVGIMPDISLTFYLMRYLLVFQAGRHKVRAYLFRFLYTPVSVTEERYGPLIKIHESCDADEWIVTFEGVVSSQPSFYLLPRGYTRYTTEIMDPDHGQSKG